MFGQHHPVEFDPDVAVRSQRVDTDVGVAGVPDDRLVLLKPVSASHSNRTLPATAPESYRRTADFCVRSGDVNENKREEPNCSSWTWFSSCKYSIRTSPTGT